MPKPLLDRLDQIPIAGLTLLALMSMVGWYVVNGGLSGGLVEIDRAAPLGYQYLVDLNSAEWPELAQLPEVGPVLAQRIVDSRRTDGPYDLPDDLMRVNGIGPKTLDRVRKHLLPLPGETQVAGQ